MLLASRQVARACARSCSTLTPRTSQAVQRRACAAKGTRGFGNLGPSLQLAPAMSQSPGSSPAAAATLSQPRTEPALASPVAPCPRLAALREAMAAANGGKGVHAYIVPTEDPHMSEYSPDCFKRREWISKFTGTAGTVVVTTNQALLWTDGRYFLQASTELSKSWTLMKAGTPGCPDLEDWLAANLPEGGCVGVDPFLHTMDAARRLQKKLEAAGRAMVPLLADGNLVDKAWGAEQPQPPQHPVRVHPQEWAGATVSAKLAAMRSQLAQQKADLLVVSTLDEVAWLFNLRGSDVSCNPVFLSYATVDVEGGACLYVDPTKVTPEVKAHLQEGQVAVKAYGAFLEDVQAAARQGKVMWMDPSKVSYAVYQAAKEAAGSGSQAPGSEAHSPAPKKARLDAQGAVGNGSTPAPAAVRKPVKFAEYASPVTSAKAVKNASELAGMREAHLRDAVALCHFLHWLESHVGTGHTVTEVEVDEKLTAQRAAQPGFVEPSFATIAGEGPNGAIIHYRAQPGSCRTVSSSSLLLLDSGGQYDCGTTDITRTMHFGTPTAHQKRCYTRVLQGHIGLDRAVFPEGTPGCALDTLARLALWQDGLNYRHGTGHGVGAALNVHEGPQSISSRFHITTPLATHMVCSNEPGYYEDGGFGIRVENLVVVKEVDTPSRFGGVPYLGFEALTLVPIQTKMVDSALMTDTEVAWLDAYHQQVRKAVAPRLADAPDVLAWMMRNTRPLAEQLADS
ncbi:peptidase M24, structural domain-containing protein [Haematococcus lacustris]